MAKAKKPNPFEKADKAMDKKQGIKENSPKDKALDAKAMAKGKAKKPPFAQGGGYGKKMKKNC